jgi:ketosteroid isomerase-like protein
MDRERAAQFIEALHRAQEELYAGGGVDAVRSLLGPNVVWHVPGQSPIAGRYEGIEEVIAYMRRRRDLAGRTFRMHRRELLVGDADHFAVLTDGTAVIGGEGREWSTIGLYRLRGELLAECHLIPFDQSEFDAIWSGAAGPGSR